MINYITKAYASKFAFIESRPDYFPSSTLENVKKVEKMLQDSEWLCIETREIRKRDAQTEGILKRCRFGSQNERRNLQAYFNYQGEQK